MTTIGVAVLMAEGVMAVLVVTVPGYRTRRGTIVAVIVPVLAIIMDVVVMWMAMRLLVVDVHRHLGPPLLRQLCAAHLLQRTGHGLVGHLAFD
jgi:hypothetical protein